METCGCFPRALRKSVATETGRMSVESESELTDVGQQFSFPGFYRDAETKGDVRGLGLSDGSKEGEPGNPMLPTRPITALAACVATTCSYVGYGVG